MTGFYKDKMQLLTSSAVASVIVLMEHVPDKVDIAIHGLPLTPVYYAWLWGVYQLA